MPGASQHLTEMIAARHLTYMVDRIMVLSYQTTGGTDDYGTPDHQYVEGPESPARFIDRPPESTQSTAQTIVADAHMTVPAEVVITELDRVALTQRLEIPLEEAVVYEVTAVLQRGVFGLVCHLKLYTGVDDA